MRIYEIITVDVTVKKKIAHSTRDIDPANFIWKGRETASTSGDKSII